MAVKLLKRLLPARPDPRRGTFRATVRDDGRVELTITGADRQLPPLAQVEAVEETRGLVILSGPLAVALLDLEDSWREVRS